MITYNINHINGLYFELFDNEKPDREYNIEFYDDQKKEIIYETKLKNNHWAKLDRKYLSDIIIFIKYKNRVVTQVQLLKQFKGKRVLITFESSSLGDTIAWMPYCFEFYKYYECEVFVSTFKNFLFERNYPELNFVRRGSVVNNIFAQFAIAWEWDKSKEPVLPQTVPLQQSASNILHLPYTEILPRIDFIPKGRPIQEKYVAISVHSTASLKLWGYWQEVIDYLVKNGYKVFEISDTPKDHKSFINQPLVNIIQLENNSIDNTMNVIHHAEFYMGLSSGLSWLAWALKKKVVMIANFTNSSHEFQSNCIRITDTNICNSCWNNPLFKFNRSDWGYCPEHEETSRQFECHKLLLPQTVIEKIEGLI
jgi:autotransporter strand-loop-strand O-heptosyltransferase